MKQQALWFAALATLCAGAAWGADDAKKDTDKLQGTWEAQAVEREGKDDPNLKGALISFNGDKFTVKMGDRVLMAGTLKVDTSKKPHTIDATVTEGDTKGLTLPGIFELDGDTLKVCSDGQGKKRPTEFKTAPDTGLMMVVAKRVKK
jgi:uncharacterized protein (TIGR03067 family)